MPQPPKKRRIDETPDEREPTPPPSQEPLDETTETQPTTAAASLASEALNQPDRITDNNSEPTNSLLQEPSEQATDIPQPMPASSSLHQTLNPPASSSSSSSRPSRHPALVSHSSHPGSSWLWNHPMMQQSSYYRELQQAASSGNLGVAQTSEGTWNFYHTGDRPRHPFEQVIRPHQPPPAPPTPPSTSLDDACVPKSPNVSRSPSPHNM